MIITLTDVKAQLEIDPAETKYDSLLTDLIEDMVIEAEAYLGVRINPVSAEEVTLDGGLRLLYLPHMNIGNVTVWEDGEELDADEFTVYGERGYLKKEEGESFLGGNAMVRVRYDGGYTGPSLPKDLKRALIRQVSYAFRRRKDIGLESQTFPDGSINKMNIGEWLPDTQEVLDRFRRYYL